MVTIPGTNGLKNIEVEYTINESLNVKRVPRYPKITSRIVDIALKYTQGSLTVPSLDWFKPQIRHYVGSKISAPKEFWLELIAIDPILKNVEDIYTRDHGVSVWENNRKLTLELRK
jgi:hypothetical protein